MFHLDFRQNQQDPDTEISNTRKLFDEISHLEEKKTLETVEEQTVPVNSSNEKVENEPTSPSKQQLQQTDSLPFIYKSPENIFAFEKISDDYVMKCPFCQIETKYIVRHIGANPNCKTFIRQEDFKVQFKLYKEKKRKEDQVKRKQISKKKLREQDEA